MKSYAESHEDEKAQYVVKLSQSVLARDLDQMMTCLEQGVPVDVLTASQRTALGMSARWGFRSGLVALLKAGANLDLPQGPVRMSPLMGALRAGQDECAELLWKAGADVNVQNVDGTTALMIACRVRREDWIKLLLPHSNVNLQTNQGLTVLDIMRQGGLTVWAQQVESRLHAQSEKRHLTEAVDQPHQGGGPGFKRI